MWALDPKGFHAHGLIELRQDGPVPVVIHQAGTYPDSNIKNEQGLTLDRTEHVTVSIAGSTKTDPTGVVTREATSVDVQRRAPRPSHGQTIPRSHGGAELPPTGTHEEQIRALILAAEPAILAALADATVLADYELDEAQYFAATRDLPVPLTRTAYEAACGRSGIEPKPDAQLDTYGYRYMEPHIWEIPLDRLIDHALGQRRCIAIERMRETVDTQPAVVHAGTQAAVVQAMGFDPLAIGGKLIDGSVFKPDASPAPPGKRCARCKTAHGVAWISGAGEYLCARHQDDY